MNETRKNFHAQLDEIRSDLIRCGALVLETIPKGTQALLDGDLALAEAVIHGDDVLDAKTLEAEDKCYQVLALQQPMASDLRSIITAIRMISELERSGDLVVNICKAARRLYGVELDPKLRGLIGQMSEQAHHLYRFALDSYIQSDASLAAAVRDIDDVLDRLHADFIQAIFESHANKSIELQVGVQLALIGRFYERIGDHAVNVGERVRYMITGWLPEHIGAARAEAGARDARDGSAAAVVPDPGDGEQAPSGS
jgi:phosphate transport system protein